MEKSKRTDTKNKKGFLLFYCMEREIFFSGSHGRLNDLILSLSMWNKNTGISQTM